jgi:sigma non-opioid intracellular receptor
MTYKIDPDALHKVAKQVVGLPLDRGELITHAIQLLADEYPELIDPAPRRWVGSKAGGILGKVRFLYFSPREYLVIFGTPTGTQGFSGRYKHVQIHKFLMAGQIDWYDLESDDTAAMTLLPGEHACMEKGQARGLTIHPGSWHIEYGRGAVVTTLPFAMVDTLLVSLELESVRRSAVEFTKLATKRYDGTARTDAKLPKIRREWSGLRLLALVTPGRTPPSTKRIRR